ncbi:hypothetical protein GCM10027044_41800 [Hymenobacter ruber]
MTHSIPFPSIPVFFLRLLLIFGVSLLVFAPITGYIAYNYGRSFWRWFGLGLLLPFVSVFIALFMAMRDKYREEKAARQQLPPHRWPEQL